MDINDDMEFPQPLVSNRKPRKNDIDRLDLHLNCGCIVQ